MQRQMQKSQEEILNGKKGPKTDAVLLNAGACIYMTRDDVTYEEAINIARQTIESGKAKKNLNSLLKCLTHLNKGEQNDS